MTAQLYATNDGLKIGAILLSNTTWVGLFKSPTLLAKGFDPTTLVECDYSGYARINVAGLGWSFPAVLDADGNADVFTPQITFRKMGAIANTDVYGFFYVASDNFTIYAAQWFVDGPYRMVVDGDYIRVTPKVVCSNPIFP